MTGGDSTQAPNDGSKLEPGAVIAGSYTLLHPLDGGDRSSWLARFEPDKALVALRLLQTEQEETRAEFRAELERVSRLDHPGLLRVLDFGCDATGWSYVATEWVKGRSLAQIIHDDWPLENQRVVSLLGQLLDGLTALHAADLCLGNLQPGSVVVRRSDEREQLQIQGVGLARFDRFSFEGLPHPALGEVSVERIIGTPVYAAPEQLRGEANDARSDIYAVGVLLFQMLTRSVPFSAACPREVAFMQRFSLPCPPSAYALVNRALEAACLRALSKTPELRFQSAAEMRAALLATQPRPSTGFDLRRSWTELRQSGRFALVVPVFRPDAISEPPGPGSPLTAVGQERWRAWLAPAAATVTLALAGALLLQSTLGTPEEPAVIALPQLAEARGRELAPAKASLAALAEPAPAPRISPASTLGAAAESAAARTPEAGHIEAPSGSPNAAPREQPAVATSAAAGDTRAPQQAADPDLAAAISRNAAAIAAEAAHAREPRSEPGAQQPGAAAPSDSRPSASTAPSPARGRLVAALPKPSERSTTKPRAASELASSAATLADGVAAIPVPPSAASAPATAPIATPGATPTISVAPASAPPGAGRPAVAIGEIHASRGSASRGALRSALNHQALERCYRASIANAGEPFALDATLEISTDMSGRVRDAKLRGSQLPSALVGCVETTARAGRVREADIGTLTASVQLRFFSR